MHRRQMNVKLALEQTYEAVTKLTVLRRPEFQRKK